jgi:ABC-type phosphate/phosphonate transport system substrate-binding protein
MAPSHAIGAVQSRLNELCAIASEAAGVTLVPRRATSYGQLARGMRAGDVGIAWMPPIPAVELEDDGAATPLALPWRQEGTSYYAALVTREGGGKALADLQGRRVAWVDRESAA